MKYAMIFVAVMGSASCFAMYEQSGIKQTGGNGLEPTNKKTEKPVELIILPHGYGLYRQQVQKKSPTSSQTSEQKPYTGTLEEWYGRCP